jgi:hypothetical protein
MDRHVLIAGIVDQNYTVSINFTTSLIRLQQRIATRGDHACRVAFEFFDTVNGAFEYFSKNEQFTRLVVIDTSMSADVDFMLRDHAPQIVVPAYPKRELDWNRIGTYIRDERDASRVPDQQIAKQRGYQYNFELKNTELEMGRYVECRDVQARIFSVAREKLDVVMDTYDRDSAILKTDCHVDVSATVVNCGNYDFAGTVATRFIVNETSSDSRD